MTPVIDIHTHFFPAHWPDLEARFGGGGWPAIVHTGPGEAMVTLGGKPFRPITSACWDIDVRLGQMDHDGIDIQVISPTPVLFAYDRPADQAAACARIFNDAAREMSAAGGRRLLSLAQVPLQDTDLACAEAERALRDGHHGVHIGNHVGDRDMDDEAILTFLQHCAAIGAPVLAHPWDMLAPDRMRGHMLGWLVGMPAETQLSIMRLILSGAFERLPRSLRLCFAHGGGSFAFLLGRADNAWRNRDIVREHCPQPPSAYCDRFFVDSAVFDDAALGLLVEVMGIERVMLGSDYPFPLGEQRVGALVQRTARLSSWEKTAVLGTNAQRWLDLDAGVRDAAVGRRRADAPGRGAVG